MSLELWSDDEFIDTTLWRPGDYYIVVFSDNGDFDPKNPYTLQVDVQGSGLAAAKPAPDIQLPVTDANGTSLKDTDVNTLFVVSYRRMSQLYGNANAIALLAQTITRLQVRLNQAGLKTAVLNLDAIEPQQAGVDTLQQMYTDWDNDPTNPFLANRIAQTIDNFITAATYHNPSNNDSDLSKADALYPNAKYIVLVGGDGVIPFYRVPDLTTLANQSDYYDYLESLDVIDKQTALSGSLIHRTTLTDDIYANDSPYEWPEHPFYLSDRAVGRLVETPEQIMYYLEQYASGQAPFEINATAPYTRALVTGYDFLEDQASAIALSMAKMGITTIDLLNDSTWNTAKLQQSWFSGLFESFRRSPYRVFSPTPIQTINTHFEHFQAYPPEAWEDFSKPTFLAESILTPTSVFESSGNFQRFFTNNLCYSVGCHGGLNVESPQTSETGQPRRSLKAGVGSLFLADFAEAYMKQGGNLVGNTGYGYGDYDLIAYSERLLSFLTIEMGRDVRDATGAYVGQPIGTALALSKQRYVNNATSFDVYDYKSLMEAVLYGLPFLRVRVPTPTDIPIEDLGPDKTPVGEKLVERIITITVTIDENKRRENIGEREYPHLEDGDVAVEDTFTQAGFRTPQPRVVTSVQEGVPVLPYIAYDLTARTQDATQNMTVKDVILLEAKKYPTLANYLPRVTEIVTQGKPLLQPTFPDGINVWYPDMIYNHSTTGVGDEQRDQLLVVPAQYKALQDDSSLGSTGNMWLYQRMTFKVIYADPTVQDILPPVISRVRVVQGSQLGLQAGSRRLVVEVVDAEGTGLPEDGVQAAYSNNTLDWQTKQFTRIGAKGGTERWVADMSEGTTEPSYIITARDDAGNVAYYNGKGELWAPQATPLSGTLTIDGPKEVAVNTPITLTGTMTLARADASLVTLPISYTWSSSLTDSRRQDRLLTLNTDQAVNDIVTVQVVDTFTPATTGVTTVTLDMGNIAETSSLSATHVVSVLSNERGVVYLPMITR